MWNLIVGPLINGVSGLFKDKARIKQAKVDGEVRLLQSASDNIATWEQLHAKGSLSSWKDEFVLLMIGFPFILGFIHFDWMDGPAIVAEGFQAFAAAPEWYSYTFVTLCFASFGIRMTTKIKSMIPK